MRQIACHSNTGQNEDDDQDYHHYGHCVAA